MYRLSLVYFLVLQGIGIAAQSLDFVHNDVNRAIALAEDQEKLIFVHGHASWCIPCRLMEEEVFIYPEVFNFLNEHFINLSLDLEDGVGPIFAARYRAEVLPYFMVLTSDETLVHAFHGFHGIEDLLIAAGEALPQEKRMVAWKKRYDEGDRKSSFLYNYA